jgi:hypothetical protein
MVYLYYGYSLTVVQRRTYLPTLRFCLTSTQLPNPSGSAAMLDAFNSRSKVTSATTPIRCGTTPSKGVANILSLANVTKHYRVTMDSANNTAMFVHNKNDGSSIKFEPSGNGLYKHELPSDTSGITQMWSMLSSVSTVANKQRGQLQQTCLSTRC